MIKYLYVITVCLVMSGGYIQQQRRDESARVEAKIVAARAVIAEAACKKSTRHCR
jgi:hypothetical protein